MNPVTPMRQIPGAYFNTPAPGANTAVRRRLNFNEPTGAGTTGLGVGGGNPAGLGSGNLPPGAIATAGAAGGQLQPVREELPPVVRAAQSINQNLQQEESYPDLDSYCRRKSLCTGRLEMIMNCELTV